MIRCNFKKTDGTMPSMQFAQDFSPEQAQSWERQCPMVNMACLCRSGMPDDKAKFREDWSNASIHNFLVNASKCCD